MDLTQQITLKNVADNWKDAYLRRGKWATTHMHETTENIYNAIMSLHQYGSTDLDNVDKIIGNISWTHNSCDSCNKKTRKPLVKFDVGGGEYDYLLCKKCLKKSLKLLKE